MKKQNKLFKDFINFIKCAFRHLYKYEWTHVFKYASKKKNRYKQKDQNVNERFFSCWEYTWEVVIFVFVFLCVFLFLSLCFYLAREGWKVGSTVDPFESKANGSPAFCPGEGVTDSAEPRWSLESHILKPGFPVSYLPQDACNVAVES